MKPGTWIVSIVLIWAAVALSGCGSIEKKERLNSFTKATRDYGRLIRWRGMDGAAQFLRARDGSSISVDLESLEEIRVTSYRIAGSQVDPDEETGQVIAEIDYYNERDNRILTLTDEQDWWFDTESTSWFLDGQLPDFLNVRGY